MTRGTGDDLSDDRRLEAALATILARGTVLACLIVGVGLAVQWSARPRLGAAAAGLDIVTAGLVLFLALPLLRLATVLVVLLRRRDRVFAGVAALVLAIIAVAVAVGAFVA